MTPPRPSRNQPTAKPMIRPIGNSNKPSHSLVVTRVGSKPSPTRNRMSTSVLRILSPLAAQRTRFSNENSFSFVRDIAPPPTGGGREVSERSDIAFGLPQHICFDPPALIGQDACLPQTSCKVAMSTGDLCNSQPCASFPSVALSNFPHLTT